MSDHAEPVVKVIDGLDGDLLDTFTIEGPASLYRTSSGETVFAVQGRRRGQRDQERHRLPRSR
ncbi:MAG: hypothetical protein NVV59_04025 [Chitinophagaceae bacterium]|nr:hypothetical protein [Chitinophagaceae bacterium]